MLSKILITLMMDILKLFNTATIKYQSRRRWNQVLWWRGIYLQRHRKRRRNDGKLYHKTLLLNINCEKIKYGSELRNFDCRFLCPQRLSKLVCKLHLVGCHLKEHYKVQWNSLVATARVYDSNGFLIAHRFAICLSAISKPIIKSFIAAVTWRPGASLKAQHRCN